MLALLRVGTGVLHLSDSVMVFLNLKASVDRVKAILNEVSIGVVLLLK